MGVTFHRSYKSCSRSRGREYKGHLYQGRNLGGQFRILRTVWSNTHLLLCPIELSIKLGQDTRHLFENSEKQISAGRWGRNTRILNTIKPVDINKTQSQHTTQNVQDTKPNYLAYKELQKPSLIQEKTADANDMMTQHGNFLTRTLKQLSLKKICTWAYSNTSVTSVSNFVFLFLVS